MHRLDGRLHFLAMEPCVDVAADGTVSSRVPVNPMTHLSILSTQRVAENASQTSISSLVHSPPLI